METATFTTTLSEMNRLYGIYADALNGEPAERARIDYETYVRRYQSERGMKFKVPLT